MLKDWNPIIISIRFWLSKRRGLMHCKAKRFLDAVKKFIRQFLDLLLLLFLWAKLLVRVQWKTFAWVFLNIFLLFAIHLGFETGLTLYVRLSPLQDFMTYFFLILTHWLPRAPSGAMQNPTLKRQSASWRYEQLQSWRHHQASEQPWTNTNIYIFLYGRTECIFWKYFFRDVIRCVRFSAPLIPGIFVSFGTDS